jgi:methionyl-tRNA formyltransferase
VSEAGHEPTRASAESWRIVVISMPVPVIERLVPVLRDLGHEPVALISVRSAIPEDLPPPFHPARLFDVLPPEVAIVFPTSKHQLESIMRAYEPDLALCWGYRWKIPAEALAVPRLGSVNQHPALLPRHRGPIPLAWALREGDAEFGVTWHRMDAELDTGAILAQTSVPIEDDDTTIETIGPKLLGAAFDLLPRVLDRVAAGDPGDPQPAEGASWAGHFGEDYAEVDWSQPARAIHNQVRAWRMVFGPARVQGPFAELDGGRVRLLRTSLRESPDAVARVEAGDGPLWILEHEPAPTD